MKVELDGKLFVLVEEDVENDDVNITVEIAGVNLWEILRRNDGKVIKIILEGEE